MSAQNVSRAIRKWPDAKKLEPIWCRRLREWYGIETRDIARKAGVEVQTYKRWERGEMRGDRKPTELWLSLVSAALRIMVYAEVDRVRSIIRGEGLDDEIRLLDAQERKVTRTRDGDASHKDWLAEL